MSMKKKHNKITALVAARIGSSRFRGKTLADMNGKPMLERQLERMCRSPFIEEVVVATSIAKDNDVLENWCVDFGVKCFRGSDEDVLGRLRAAAEAYKGEVIVEILGDNPLVHSSLIDACLELYFSEGIDYVATLTNEYPQARATLPRFPIGVRVQVFSIDTLRRCEELAKNSSHREHATSFIAQNPKLFKTKFVTADGDFENCNRPELTFAVNKENNLNLVRNIFSACNGDDTNFSVCDAIRAFDANPQWQPLMGNEA